MGVQVTASTMPGALTPTCNECGVVLCWDISDEEYAEAQAFWEAWICADCNGGEPLELMRWVAEQRENERAISNLAPVSRAGKPGQTGNTPRDF